MRGFFDESKIASTFTIFPSITVFTTVVMSMLLLMGFSTVFFFLPTSSYGLINNGLIDHLDHLVVIAKHNCILGPALAGSLGLCRQGRQTDEQSTDKTNSSIQFQHSSFQVFLDFLNTIY
jgi:hypothetical protein